MTEDLMHANASDAERALLAAVLTGHPIVDEVADVVTARDFYQPKNEAVWNAVLQVRQNGDRVDPLTLPVPPKARPYLVELLTAEAEPLHAMRYARLVVDGAQRRRLHAASTQVKHLAETEADASQAAEEARRLIDDAAVSVTDKGSGIGISDLLTQTLDGLETRGDEAAGVSTGWSDLDREIGGLRPGQLAVVGARPSVGKSVVAANIAAAACKSGVGVHFASLEMSRQEVMERLLSAQATVNLGRLRGEERLTDDDWSRIAAKATDLQAWPLWVDDQGAQSLLQIRARARSTARRFPLGLIVVDYLQLMTPRARNVPREQQVGELSEGLKALAKELSVPVLALSQVNRGPADRKDQRPMMSDLRESGRIEADADHVWLLHRPDLVDPNSTTGELELYVAKNRNGPQGKTITLQFFGHYSRAQLRAWSPSGVVA